MPLVSKSQMAAEEYVFVCPDENSRDRGVELPAESDGTLLLSVLQSQFENASGIKYRYGVCAHFSH